MRPLCAGCGGEIVDGFVDVGGVAWHHECLAGIPAETSPPLSNAPAFSSSFEVTLEGMSEARNELLSKLEQYPLPPTRLAVYVDADVPLDRPELDDRGEPTGEREDVLCWRIESLADGADLIGARFPAGLFRPHDLPLLLVHPDRLELFRRTFGYGR